MNNTTCRFGYTEQTCAQKDYPPCGDGGCELPSRPIPQKFVKRFHR